MNTRLFALFGALLLAGVALGPAAAAGSTDAGNAPLAIGVTQDDGVTVAVTANGTAVADATVDVVAVGENASYAGAGTHTTGANGSVDLPASAETVDVSFTASTDERTAETTTTLHGTDEADGNLSFGQQVSEFVHSLQQSSNATGIGQAVSTFVVANNPGNAPAHAGGPGGPNATTNETDRGPPAFLESFFGGGDDAGNETGDNDRRGPPAHAGGPDQGNETDGDETGDEHTSDADRGNGSGPPDHAGGADDDRGNGQGPPDHAGNDADDADESDAE